MPARSTAASAARVRPEHPPSLRSRVPSMSVATSRTRPVRVTTTSPLHHLKTHAALGDIGLNEPDCDLAAGGALALHRGQDRRIADLHQATAGGDVNDRTTEGLTQ